MKYRSDRGGFTLIELMVTLGIFAFLIVAVYTFLAVGDSTTEAGLTYIEISQDARLGIDRMINELRSAQCSAVSIPDGSYITFRVPTNPNLIQYSLGGIDGGQLIRTEAGTDTILCNNAHSVQFNPSPFSGSVISITLQTQETSSSRHDFTTTLSGSVKVRN